MYKDSMLYEMLRDRRLLLAGYGREGKSTHALLVRLGLDKSLTIVEDNESLRREASQGYDLIIKSPGIPLFVLEDVCDLDTVSSQTDLFLRMYAAQTIGITGTKGKSTTSYLLYRMLRVENPHNVLLAGNMGVPLFDIMPQISPEATVVCELSCHQLESIHRAPHIGVVLNLYQEHLDHYHSYADYQLAKMQMGLKQCDEDALIYCADPGDLANCVEQHRAEFRSALHGYTQQSASRWESLPHKLKGQHNLLNFEAAALAARLAGASEGACELAVGEFQGLEHRIEPIGTFQSITFYNDSISTIPQATVAAVEALKTVDTLILGGYDRGIDYSALAHFLTSKSTPGGHIRNLAFVGEAGRRIYDACGSLDGREVLLEDDYRKIVAWCYRVTAPHHVCLLSPAAASYDSFKNFEHRGQTFKNLVRQYAK